MTPVGAHEAVGETGVMNAAPTTPRSALAAYFGNRHYRPRSRPHLLWFMGEGKTTYQEVL